MVHRLKSMEGRTAPEIVRGRLMHPYTNSLVAQLRIEARRAEADAARLVALARGAIPGRAASRSLPARFALWPSRAAGHAGTPVCCA